MKMVEAIVRPGKLREIQDALRTFNIRGMTISQVLGFGNQKGYKEFYRGAVVDVNLLEKVKIEIVCRDEDVDGIVDFILRISKTGEVGDGKIFVHTIENAFRIRTGESGNDAL
jgi:nitrogen regulatory protein P-II 1